MLPNIFNRQDKDIIFCPRCLTKYHHADLEEFCAVCNYEFPIQYRASFKGFHPFFIQVFGWTAHGKTVYLQAMRLMLLNMHTFWPQYSYQPLTQLDINLNRELNKYLQRGEMPPATQIIERLAEEVYVMHLDQMMRWGSRTMVMVDHAGELFKELNVNTDSMPFLLKTPTTFMLISIPKIKEDAAGQTMDQLLSIYIETMLRNKVNFKSERRNLVIVLTMADAIPSLPPHLRNYLASDTVWSQMRTKGIAHMNDKSMEEYMERLHWVDEEIRYWLQSDGDGAPGGRNLVGSLRRENINARFALVSATGHGNLSQQGSGEENKGIPISPKRVLDPLFWALEFQSQ